MKRTILLFLAIILQLTTRAQGWPADYGGVMLQGFFWDSYKETSWARLQAQADEIAPYFQLVWVPQSGWCNSGYNMMGYTPVYYFNQNSSFGSEAELRSMIAAFRKRGTGVMADVVINHRQNLGQNGSWVDYPAETYNGHTYQMLPSDICRNDDGGATQGWAGSNGISLSQNDDTGEDWSGCRDLDHKSPNVQECVKAYLRFLLEDIGYTGFRYDMVKGFYAYFIADYNTYAKPAFSVGEFWDSTGKIKEWVNNSKGYVSDTPTSATFDFQFRYRMRDAVNSRDWRWLGYDEKPLSADSYYKQYAVTFVENHDTEKRTSGAEQDPIRTDTLAANAYLLAMPGTPCIFYTHWRDNPYPLKQMILARRLAGITNTSDSQQKYSAQNYYATATTGRNATLLCVVGNTPQSYSVSKAQYTEILSGKGYRYLLSRSANTVWMDVPDGTYEAPLAVQLTAVSNLSGASIVYTLDGSEPTAESPRLASGSTLSIESSCTLRAGILSEGKVQGIQQREYKIFQPHDITLYVRSDVTWTGMTFYAWDNDDRQLNGNWPGKRISSSKTAGGKRWYYQTFRLTSPQQYINLVVSTSSANRQTVDVTGLRTDSYLCITSAQDGGKYVVEDVTADTETSIESLTPPLSQGEGAIYDLSGRRINSQFSILNSQLPKGIYIVDGKKVVF
ncbi:MAG: chitobiase/beta-hexosaminidase C-terminal domain-containing protein [Bacteroidaceae bacterium]|nr:chitobiase/beta-hexosaminidase C-terminal domain-containing protein [Bacteroidaceae bacterium]